MAKKLIAVIDVGSLTARLKVFEINSKGYPKAVETVRKFTTIGAKSVEGIIPAEQVNELCRCLDMFRTKCDEYKVTNVICVATSVFRDAGNRDVVLEQIRARTGFKIDILDNSMECYYQNLAVRESYPDFGKMISEGTMLLDIGSGSMQATVYDKSEFIFSQNMVLGSLRISGMLSTLQNRTTHYADVLEEFIAQDLNDYHAVEPKGITYKHLIAFSGGMSFIRMLGGFDPFSECTLSKDEFMKIYNYLLKTRPSDLTLNNSIPAHAAPLLLPVAMIIRDMLEYTGLDQIYLPHASMSDGVMFSYCHEKFGLRLVMNPSQDLVSGARNIAKRYRCDKKHIEFVEKAALDIFDCCQKMAGLEGRDRLLLQLAAILHEIGKFVKAKGHNEAAFSLIEYMDLIGITSDELNTIAYIVRLYPQDSPYDNYYYRNLPPKKKVTISKLTSILRIADSLDASHTEKIANMSVTLHPDRLHISCEAREDMSFEEWAFEHRCDLFKDVMGIEARLRVRRQV
ncbi:exopolyphosphatase / guanosine-5'-triphosphate,3'-diphosphate pyrophosphatase [Ruminococcaceae bacterium YRB3002]|nr:exopolyphosphatase / guanosine-5'-triphosphate,3'-diphosphate pyrophosphatase [Ruminococcaceae bacterium YRB3002]